MTLQTWEKLLLFIVVLWVLLVHIICWPVVCGGFRHLEHTSHLKYLFTTPNVRVLLFYFLFLFYQHTHSHTHWLSSAATDFDDLRSSCCVKRVDVKRFTHTITINTKNTCGSSVYPAHIVCHFLDVKRNWLGHSMCLCVCVCEHRGRMQCSVRDTPVRDLWGRDTRL